MIEVEQAVAKAKEYAQRMIGPLNFTLEEVERDKYKGREVWILTLGYPKQPDPSPLASGSALGGIASLSELGAALRRGERDYKTFFIDARDGAMIAMKLRVVTPS